MICRSQTAIVAILKTSLGLATRAYALDVVKQVAASDDQGVVMESPSPVDVFLDQRWRLDRELWCSPR